MLLNIWWSWLAIYHVSAEYKGIQHLFTTISKNLSVRVTGQLLYAFSLFITASNAQAQIQMCHCSLNQSEGVSSSQTTHMLQGQKTWFPQEKTFYLFNIILISQHYRTVFPACTASLFFSPHLYPLFPLSSVLYRLVYEMQRYQYHTADGECWRPAECRMCPISKPLLPAAVPLTAAGFSARSQLHDEHKHTTETKRPNKR